MKKIKNRYELSNKADIDLEEIFDYTKNEFGINQAIKYVSEFSSKFNHLLINPTIGRHRLEINNKLFSLSKDEHLIFYEILENSILIVRILHGSRDLPKHFQKPF